MKKFALIALLSCGPAPEAPPLPLPNHPIITDRVPYQLCDRREVSETFCDHGFQAVCQRFLYETAGVRGFWFVWVEHGENCP